MIALHSGLARLVEPLLAPEGWMSLALLRLEQDPLAARVQPGERARLARAARAAGADIARRALGSGWASAEESLRDRGVVVHEDGGEAVSGPFVHHALYTAPPPRVTLYRRPLAVLERLLDAAGLRGRLGAINAREVILAHELCHHLVHAGGAPEAVRPRVEVLRLGPWRRRAVVRSAEEIAAAGFAAVWCGIGWPPELLDCLTLAAWRDPVALAMLGAQPSLPAA
jgi:predicted Zn-dependent protease with MMP-like domain